MPLINTSVPNLIQGVSQQPDATRFAGQCEEQVNALSSVADGLKKRPNTRHIARLMTEAIDSDSFVHFIDRSEVEKYVIIQTTAPAGQNNLRAFNVTTGTQCTINGSATHLLANSDYLTSSSPELTTQALTIADTTFLNNNTKTPQLTNSISPQSQKEAIVVVRQGDYDTDYIVKMSSNPLTTGGSTVQAGTVATFHNSGNEAPQLEEILPATVPPRYKLKASQYEPANTNSPLDDGGEGYDANNSQINVTSNGTIIQLPSVTANLTGSAITSLNLNNSGVFEGVLSSSNTFNLAVTFTQSESGNTSGTSYNSKYTGTVDYTMTISGADLTAYNSAGRPPVNITFTGNNYSYVLNQGGILEYDPFGATYSNLRAQNYFPNVTFSAAGVHTGSKIYTNVKANGVYWWPLLKNSSHPSSWVTQTQNVSVTNTTYAPPTITLSAGIPASTQGAGTAESDYKSAAASDTSNNTSSREKINTNRIAAGIVGDFTGNSTNDLALFSREQDQNLLILRPVSPTTQEFYVSTSDGLADTGLQLLYKEVASISELPIYCKDGFKIKVQGDPSLNEDDFYAEFQTNDNATFGSGVWNESIGFGVSTTIDADTMPHGLINVGLDEFVLGPFDGGTKTATQYGAYIYPNWADRTVGDDDSNPFNSFIGTTPISAMTLFKNRLAFITGNNVSFSEAGQFFNFSRTTVRSLLDSAPIDVSVSSPQVTDITACVPYQGSLLLFADNSQLKLAGGDILSPRTVSITPVTQFAYQSKVEPLVLGSYIYYPFNRGNFSGINEFNVNATTDTFDANEITEHVPAYIPSNINLMASSSAEDYLVVSNKGTNCLYVYTFFWNGNEKVLSSWSKFEFTDFIQGISFIDSNLSIVMTDKHLNTHLVSLPFESGMSGSGYGGGSVDLVTLLDKRVRAQATSGSSVIKFEQSDGSYSGGNADQPYTFYNIPAGQSIPTGGAPLSEVFVDSTGTTHALKALNTGGIQVHLTNGNASADLDGYVGVPYTMKYKFSTQVFKASAGKSSSPTNASAMHVRNGTLFFDDTHTFDVKVTPENRTTATSTFLADDLPEAEEAIVEEYPNIATPDFNSEGVVFSRTNEQTFTIVASNSTANKYIEFANSSNGMVAGKHRITFDADFLTGSPSNILLSYADVDADPSGHPYGSASIKEGSNVIEIDVFDDNTLIAGGTNPDPKIYWRINSGSTLNLSVTNFKIERISPIKFAEGNFRFPIYSKAKHADICIENSSPFDSKFSSAEFESFVHPRSSRYG
jgi:hypothetical protein